MWNWSTRTKSNLICNYFIPKLYGIFIWYTSNHVEEKSWKLWVDWQTDGQTQKWRGNISNNLTYKQDTNFDNAYNVTLTSEIDSNWLLCEASSKAKLPVKWYGLYTKFGYMCTWPLKDDLESRSRHIFHLLTNEKLWPRYKFWLCATLS